MAFSPLSLGSQIRQDFALHYGGDSVSTLARLLSRMEGRGRLPENIPTADLLSLLQEVTRIKGPYVHTLPVPRLGGNWTDFAASEGLHPAIVESFRFGRLFTHQEQAIRAVLAGKNTLLSAATGRGKTEGWLIPILQRIVEEKTGNKMGGTKHSVKALLMYPTKALAQDQLKRLLRYLFHLNRYLARDGAPPITVGIWDGDTPRRVSDNEDYYLQKTIELIPCPLHGPDCQHLRVIYLPSGRPVPAIRYKEGHEDVAFDFVYLTKDDILAEPVDILLTNPDSINWRLINVNALDELRLFVQQPRFIVFDEVHLYSGLFGAFVSTLMKRYLRTRVALWERQGVDRIKVEKGIQFIAASATVANKEDLFRQICPVLGAMAIVEEEPREVDDDWPVTVPPTWKDSPFDAEGIIRLAKEVSPRMIGASGSAVALENAYEAIAAAIDDPSAVPLQLLRVLHATLRRHPMTIEQIAELITSHYPGLSNSDAGRLLDNFFTIGQAAGVLENRVHLFSWPLEGLYACLRCGRVHPGPTHVCANPECSGRFVTRVNMCQECGQPNLDGWFCPTCRLVHPFHSTIGGERAFHDWRCPVCETEGSRVVWQPLYECPKCGWRGKDSGGPQLVCQACDHAVQPSGYDEPSNTARLPVICRRENCSAVHVGTIPEVCTCGEKTLYYGALFDLHAVEKCNDCRQLREHLPGAACNQQGHTSQRVAYGQSSYVVVRYAQQVVRAVRETSGKAGCCSDGTPIKNRRFLSFARTPDHLAVTLSQYLLRRIVEAEDEDLEEALSKAKLMSFSDSIRDMESLGRDFNEPEASLGLQATIVSILKERSSFTLTLAELHRAIVAWQEVGPTFATRVEDSYWGKRALANELIPGQYRSVPALPRHGIVDVGLDADISGLPETSVELLRELARNNHQREDNLRRHEAYDQGLAALEKRGFVERYVDDDRGDIFLFLNPALVRVSLVGPNRPISFNQNNKHFVTTLAQQLGVSVGDFVEFDVPWRERVDLEHRDLFSQLAFRLSILDEPVRLDGQVYRGATNKVTRRRLEADFRDGPRPNFLSTGPAMEVGIDIGDLNALLLFGTPPNINAYLQRVGRAGRSEKRSLVISVSKMNPIDFYYYEHPQDLIASRPEPVPLNEHNEEVLRISLTWALQDWVAANFWIPWRQQEVRDDEGQSRKVMTVADSEVRIEDQPFAPSSIHRWSYVYHLPAYQIALGEALARLSELSGPNSLYAPEPRRWLESILNYRFCRSCGGKFVPSTDMICHDERPALAADVFRHLIDDAIVDFEERLLAFLFHDVSAVEEEMDKLMADLQQLGSRRSGFGQRASQSADPSLTFRRSEIERSLERLINYKQQLEKGRFSEAHTGSVEGKYAYSLRGAGDTAEVISWRPNGEDVHRRESRELAMVMSDHHPYGVFVQENRTYVVSRVEWEPLADVWRRKDLRDVRLGGCLCGGGEISAQGICSSCDTRYVGIRKVHLYPSTARLASEPGSDRRAQPRDVHWRPTSADASNSHAEVASRILPNGFRPQTGHTFVLESDGVKIGELAYGDLDLVIMSREYTAHYEDGAVDPVPRPYDICGECGGVLVHDDAEPTHCLFDAGHDVDRRVRIGLVDVLRTKGLQLLMMDGLALTHSIAHGMRLSLQKIAGVDVRSIGEIVTEDVVYLFDTEPGGSGVCQLLVARDEDGHYSNFAESMRITQAKLATCDCDVACPRCLMQFGCAARNSLRTLNRPWTQGILNEQIGIAGANR